MLNLYKEKVQAPEQEVTYGEFIKKSYGE